MRLPTTRRLSALLAVAVIAAALSAAFEPEPPTAAAHNESPSTWECSHPVWSPGFGTHSCHNWSDHYTITSFFRRAVTGPGPGIVCDTLGRCSQSTSVSCETSSSGARCNTPSGSPPWQYTSSNTAGPYSHAVSSSATFGCSSSSHRHGGGCHRHALSPPATMTCGSWHPHDGGGGTRPPSRGGNPNPGTPAHTTTVLGPCGVNPPIINPPIINPPIVNPTTPELSVAGQTVDEDAGAVDFTITLSPTATSAVTVDVATSDGTATAGSDYASVTARTVTIPASSTTAIVSVTVTDDAADEPDETFTLTLSNPSNANLAATSSATATIRDDDAAPPARPTNVMFDCTVSGGVFTLNASWGPPAAGASGYQAQLSSNPVAWGSTGELYFGAGSATSMTATAPSVGTYYAVIWPYGVPGVGPGDQVQASTECELPLEVSVTDAADVREGLALVFTVSLSAASTADVTVDVAAVGVTATEGVDYLAKRSTVTITAGSTSVDVRVFTVADLDGEFDETLELVLSSPSGATLGSATSADGRILDDDEPDVSIEYPAGSVDEDTGGTANDIDFTVRLDKAAVHTVTVVATTSSGTATGGTCGSTGIDYAHKSNTVTFSPGDLVATFTVRTCPDTVAGEGTEDFTVALSSPSNAVLGTATATGQIDDSDAVTVRAVGPAGPVDEDTSGATNYAVFAVRLDVAAARAVTVIAATTSGTATGAPCGSGGDFVHRSRTVTFTPGDVWESFPVPLCADAAVENDEVFGVVINSPSNAVLGTNTASATILDNDEPTVSISAPAGVDEDTNGVANDIVFTVSLDVAHVRTVTVSASTTSGTATGGMCGFGGADFTHGTLTLTLNPGVLTTDFTVSTCPDTTRNEGAEDFTVTISGATNASLGTSTATGRILDNDSPPIYR